MEKKNKFLFILGRSFTALFLLGLIVVSIIVTKPDFGKLITSFSKSKDILTQLTSPTLFSKDSTVEIFSQPIPIPCGSAELPEIPAIGARIAIEPACANVKDKVWVKGYDLARNSQVSLRYILPSGDEFSLENLETDENGSFAVEMTIRPIAATKDGVPSQFAAFVSTPSGVFKPSPTLKEVFNSIYVTVFMALIATTLGSLIAIPLSFLAASNITRKGFVGSAVYYIVRGFLNLIRSYEAMVMATVFAMIVGFGSPFAGVLALSVVTAASLGKMFSEAVESIDPGPIEALTATGANRFQVVYYAVIPQIIPDYLSFIIYHWDINVRISTVIGYVGGGGIGYFLQQKINTFEYSKAGTAILAIIIVVWLLDFFSAEVRKRLI